MRGPVNLRSSPTEAELVKQRREQEANGEAKGEGWVSPEAQQELGRTQTRSRLGCLPQMWSSSQLDPPTKNQEQKPAVPPTAEKGQRSAGLPMENQEQRSAVPDEKQVLARLGLKLTAGCSRCITAISPTI
ncbi:Hypothetical protein SMAX5B_014820 [Scophthalmus maximus]|uniref:Uncharacterized protein n=1 Tax=Scophthalmus maximus TaxID=52904 RepID=A0A2U9C016_SCOMX|nr:Hypothetical protein SMAX5B_014820 [Scophthalmus maximus]